MKALFEAQELARRNNENETVRRCFEKKRALRRTLDLPSPFSEAELDDLDWRAAERECREKRAIGFAYPSPDTDEAKETH